MAMFENYEALLQRLHSTLARQMAAVQATQQHIQLVQMQIDKDKKEQPSAVQPRGK